MPPLPRATCPECFREVALRVGGELREHRDIDVDRKLCPSSGLTVEQSRAEVERSIERFRSEVANP